MSASSNVGASLLRKAPLFNNTFINKNLAASTLARYGTFVAGRLFLLMIPLKVVTSVSTAEAGSKTGAGLIELYSATVL